MNQGVDFRVFEPDTLFLVSSQKLKLNLQKDLTSSKLLELHKQGARLAILTKVVDDLQAQVDILEFDLRRGAYERLYCYPIVSLKNELTEYEAISQLKHSEFLDQILDPGHQSQDHQTGMVNPLDQGWFMEDRGEWLHRVSCMPRQAVVLIEAKFVEETIGEIAKMLQQRETSLDKKRVVICTTDTFRLVQTLNSDQLVCLGCQCPHSLQSQLQ